MNADNPFFHRGAIRNGSDFHGRDRELGQIMGLFRNGQSVSLIGPRRIGKSSLLLHLCRPETGTRYGLSPDKTVLTMLDCQELGGSSPEDVYEALLVSVVDASRSLETGIAGVGSPGSYRLLDRALSSFGRQGVQVVFLLDEFEILAANSQLTPYFFARLRGLTTKHGVAFLTASQRPLFSITADDKILSSPFFNIFVTISLGLFSLDESHELMKLRLNGTSVTFSDELRQQLLEHVGPHPFFLHLAGYHAYNHIAQRSATRSSPALDQAVAATEMEAESHLGYLWLNLSPQERYCLATMDGPIETMRQLEQQCLIWRRTDSYDYTGKMLRRFVRRQEVENVIQAGPFVVDQRRHQVTADGQPLNLTASQYDLLVRLGTQAGQVVAGNDLEAAVWGDALVDDPDRLKTLIKRLRRAIEPFSTWIASERGVGYVLREPN